MAKANDDAAESALMLEDRLRKCNPCRFSHRHYTDLLHRSESCAGDISCRQYVDVVPAVVEMSRV